MDIIKTGLPSIQKEAVPETGIVSFKYQKIKYVYITAQPLVGSGHNFPMGYWSRYLQDENAQVLSHFVFGSPGMCGENFYNPSENECPVTYIHGDMPSPRLIYGTQMYLISGSKCTPIILDGQRAGTYYEDKDAEYCFLGDIRPNDKKLTPSGQTAQTFDNIKKALESTGMDFLHIVRTWFYLDKLYDWYPEFNEIRTAFFRGQGVFDNFIPASTGIGAGNLHGTSLVANVLAVKPKHPGVRVKSVSSPMQGEATEYKSSFSRAVEIQFPAYRQLYISGTASIDYKGVSIHIGNINRQIDETMKVVGQIIGSRSMDWGDAVRAIAYFKDIRHVAEFCDYCQKNQIPSFPVSYCQSDICRQELLFEIELDFIKVENNRGLHF